MTPFFALLQSDLVSTMRVWFVRMWLTLTVMSGVSAVILSRAYEDPTSFFLGWALLLDVALGSFVFIVISAGATSTELPYLGNSIISRGITPIQYVLSKFVSRTLVVLSVFLVVAVPVSILMVSQGKANDLDYAGISLALSYITLLLAFLVVLGVTFSTIFNNTMASVVILEIIWYISFGVALLAQGTSFTRDGVLGLLPAVLQGVYNWGDSWPFMLVLVVPIVGLPILGLRFFQQRDL